MENPLKVQIVSDTSSGSVTFSDICSFIGVFAWCISTIVMFVHYNWFSNTLGVVSIIPSLFAAGILGYLLTPILVKIGIVGGIGYLLYIWINN